jgi:hypothetical protein
MVSYNKAHYYVRKYKPQTLLCELCDNEPSFEIANLKNHNYTLDLHDYVWICKKCHSLLDGSSERMKGNQLMRDPEIRKKVYNPNRNKKISLAMMGNKNSKDKLYILSDSERKRRSDSAIAMQKLRWERCKTHKKM